jgi:uncharacterized membrane protein
MATAEAVLEREAPAVIQAVAKSTRVESIDLLRGTVMIIMALDHVRDYFHRDAFLYSPTDLSRTTVLLFLTRWITHFCAPVFVFLAGVSACLYGSRRSRKELSSFLWTRGVWLVLVELFILSLFRTFNPSFPFFNLQVIWAIGISMIVLSAMVHMEKRWVLSIGLLLIAGHNLLDTVHVPGSGLLSFLWAFLHERRLFTLGRFLIQVQYPVLPWIGTMAVGYWFGGLYSPEQEPARRRKILLLAGLGASVLFVVVRAVNGYGDPVGWSAQPSALLDVLSFLNLTKYPPSLLYLLMTLGPALIALALTEQRPGAFTAPITVFGRVPMFYYLAHILLIHAAATLAAPLAGHRMADMILSTSVFDAPTLKGYGFDLPTVYLVWAGLVIVLFPFCKWFDRYKRAHQPTKWWLSYL